MKYILTILVSLVFQSNTVIADDEYWVTQYRAAPGKLPDLLELVTSTDWAEFNLDAPIMMRHSQGNHWDIMLLGAQGNCESEACTTAVDRFSDKARQLVDFELSFLAKSTTTWKQLRSMNEDSGLYHIEMFNAAAGKHAALHKEREMENDYIVRTGGRANVIFETTFGSDIDNFTVGFYRDMPHFAARPDLTPEEAETAAKAAGFKNRADISFLLRELIVGHHDTLATKIQ